MWSDFEAAAESNIRWFGAERKSQMKQVVRLIADVGTALDEVEDNQEETKKLNIAMKKTNAMLSICRGHHTQKDFCSSFDEAEKFAQMAPAIDEIPCPVWLRQLRYSHQVGKCDTPSSFWVLLSPAEMVKAKILEAEGPSRSRSSQRS